MVITIDGPGGVGKTTVARGVARALDLPHLDTGSTYRAAALATLRAGGDVQHPASVLAAVDATDFAFEDAKVLMDGEDVTEELRTSEVTSGSSAVAVHPEVRERVVGLQRAWLAERGGSGVVEGRDIGTVVFPDAAVKAYLTASPEVRAARRADDPESAGKSVEEIAAELRARDERDSTRAASPLRPAADAVIIDTAKLSADEVTALVLRLVAEARVLEESSLLAEHRPRVVALTRTLRAVVRSALPEVTERVYPGWKGLGYHHPDAGYLGGVFPRGDGVSLAFEHGTELPDPDGLLQGEGSRVRSVMLEEWDEKLREPITDLLDAAAELEAGSR